MYGYYTKARSLKSIKNKNNREYNHPPVTTVNIYIFPFNVFHPLRINFI